MRFSLVMFDKQPYGPLTKMDFVVHLSKGEIIEFATQCFFDDTIGWSPSAGEHDPSLVNPSDVKGTITDERHQLIKSAKLGERLRFNLGLSDCMLQKKKSLLSVVDFTFFSVDYKTLLPISCKFSSSRDKDDKNDVYFVQNGYFLTQFVIY